MSIYKEGAFDINYLEVGIVFEKKFWSRHSATIIMLKMVEFCLCCP